MIKLQGGVLRTGGVYMVSSVANLSRIIASFERAGLTSSQSASRSTRTQKSDTLTVRKVLPQSKAMLYSAQGLLAGAAQGIYRTDCAVSPTM